MRLLMPLPWTQYQYFAVLCAYEHGRFLDIWAGARSHHPYCDPKQYHRSLGPSLPI